MRTTILVIPAEGDSPKTEQWYINELKQHYGPKVDIIVFQHSQNPNIAAGTLQQIRKTALLHKLRDVEIHAQGGLGAYVACQMEYLLNSQQPVRSHISRIFFIGGAPSNAMTRIAKLFHRYFAYIWHLSPVPFFADDPNPHNDPIIDQIRRSSTQTMRSNPKLYRNQLALIGNWGKNGNIIDPEIIRSMQTTTTLKAKNHPTANSICESFFVPNGETIRPKWWDNTYDQEKAIISWRKHGVNVTSQPTDNFSFYSMMPAKAPFAAMDEVRQL